MLEFKAVDSVKWVATIIQLIGYGLTGLGLTPWNIYFFLVGIVLWFIVGVLWKDRAIMIVHIGAFFIVVNWLFECLKGSKEIRYHREVSY